MNPPVERRVRQRDPRELMSAEVLALLRACGRIRKTDQPILEGAVADAPAPSAPGPLRTRR